LRFFLCRFLQETEVFDNTNPYTIRFEETDGRKRYFVAFTDGQGNFRETEVTKAVYMEFCHFIKRERNLRRSDERHLEQSELTEETLCRRAVNKPKPVDEAVNDTIRMERLNRAIMELPEIQRRRFMLHFDLGLTYEQIRGQTHNGKDYQAWRYIFRCIKYRCRLQTEFQKGRTLLLYRTNPNEYIIARWC
jgi:RNA polymerase sigma-70 factor (ECF subfamily)